MIEPGEGDSLQPIHEPAPDLWVPVGPRGLRIRVDVEDSRGNLVATYVMNHDNPQERRVLGEQCRAAFLAGQSVMTYPEE